MTSPHIAHLESFPTLERSVVAAGERDLVSGDTSGGTNTSHTIVIDALRALLEVVSAGAPQSAYELAVVEGNVLGKRTEGARKRTLRYLKELYLLRPDSLLFRALRDLWPDDDQAQPLLGGLCALARDSVFRASFAAVASSPPGDEITSADFAAAVGEKFPNSYSEATLAKIGRNTFSSWEQTGHLKVAGRRTKSRTRARCRPANLTYALLLGHIQGHRGQSLFETFWAKALDQPTSHLYDLASAASQRGFLEMRNSGGVVEISFRELLRPFSGPTQGPLS